MSKKKKPSRKKGRSSDHLVGRLSSLRSGGAFVSAEGVEYFVSARHLNGAMHGDTVAFRPSASTRLGATAHIARVVERAHATIIGTFHHLGPLGVIIPRDERISYDVFVESGSQRGAQEGDWVKATITTYPSRHQSMQAVITEVLASKALEQQALPEEVILADNDIVDAFSEEALSEARALTLDVEQTLVEQPERVDLRARDVFTIDPSDARDFDDALSVEFLPGGRTRLGVHIADVAHYVTPDSALDACARLKTTSTYLPTRVIPMLPEELSQDLCSLNPDQPRLAMTVDLIYDRAGDLVDQAFYPSVIESRNRYTYDEVLAMLQGALPYTSPEQKEALSALDSFAQTHKYQRALRGGIELSARETKVLCDERGKPVKLIVRQETRATSMIEEAMIAANEAVAEYLLKEHVQSVYRVHEPPEPDALDALAEPLRGLGYQLPARGEVTPKAFQMILDASKGRPDEFFVSQLLLRSLKQAYYAPESIGHFGLASAHYTHFTSPIRRYPDLLVHRALKSKVTAHAGGRDVESNRYGLSYLGPGELSALCHHCSVGERNAQRAEREALRIKLCEFLADKVGEEFDGIISNVAHFGLFVTLENSAEGLVHRQHLPAHEQWTFSPQRHQFTNEKRTKRYRLGQPIRVLLLSVDLHKGFLDFKIVD